MTTTLRPVRFTDDIPAVQAFLEGLGLQPRISSNRPGWVDLLAADGLVALHSAHDSTTGALPGETRLSLELDDADAAVATLRAAGVEASVVDEAWGRQLELTDPDGRTMLCDERSDDLYGYTAHPVDPSRPGPRVVPVVVTRDPAAYRVILDALGVGPDAVELHAGDAASVQLSFVVTDPDGQPVRVRPR